MDKRQHTETADQKERTWVPDVIIKSLNQAWSHPTFTFYVLWSITVFPCIIYLYLGIMTGLNL